MGSGRWSGVRRYRPKLRLGERLRWPDDKVERGSFAIDAWRDHRHGDVWWLHYVSDPALAQIQIIDEGTASNWYWPAKHQTWCDGYFDNRQGIYATTLVEDEAQGPQPRGLNTSNTPALSGFFEKAPGVQFKRTTICLNPAKNNDKGTIAHELGHALGLDHVTSTFYTGNPSVVSGYASCSDTDKDSIMSYIYEQWGAQWPEDPNSADYLEPTEADVDGPWVCNTAFPGGLYYVYGIVGDPTETPTYTNTPTPTRTPTRTPTPTNTPTPTPTPVDMDGDGFLNPQQTLHLGPANTNAAYDNCPSVANPSQLNSDGNFIDLSPPKLFDDATMIRSDALGDACDTDDDNDGRSDAAELAGNGCADQVTDPLNADTDGDRALDGAECQIGTDPLSTASAPTQAQCGNTSDADSDLISAFREYCYYGSDKDDPDSDGDGCSDGREMASVNADQTVNAIDSSQVSQAFGIYAFGAEPYKYNFDLTKDGTINATYLSQLAQQYGACA